MFAAPSEEDHKSWEAQLKKEPAASAKNAFLPLHQKSKGGMCGSAKSVTATYPGYWYVLSDEIKNRKSFNSPITETEVWGLLNDLATVTAHYHKNHIKVGDIRPENVLLNDDSKAAVITQHSFPGEQTNYSKTLFGNEKTYLSPEEMKDLNLGVNQPRTNLELSEAFSIGLTCMDAALMEDSDDIYDSKQEGVSLR